MSVSLGTERLQGARGAQCRVRGLPRCQSRWLSPFSVLGGFSPVVQGAHQCDFPDIFLSPVSPLALLNRKFPFL